MGFAENGMSPADFAAMSGNGFGNGFGGDGAWWLLVLFLFMFNGGWGAGYGGNAGTNADLQRGFDQSAVMNGLTGIQAAVTSGFGDTALGISNLNQSLMQQNFNAQTAMLQGFNNMQSQFANCCCENRLAVANLGADIAREACADRQAVNDGVRDIMAAVLNQTQVITNKMDQMELNAKNEEIANLRSQINMMNLAASQAQQTLDLRADNTAQTQYIVNRVAPYPIPSYTVPNPFGTATTAGA